MWNTAWFRPVFPSRTLTLLTDMSARPSNGSSEGAIDAGRALLAGRLCPGSVDRLSREFDRNGKLIADASMHPERGRAEVDGDGEASRGVHRRESINDPNSSTPRDFAIEAI